MGGSSSGIVNYRGLPASGDFLVPGYDAVENVAFQTELGGFLGGLLANYNDRDHALIEKRLAPVVEDLCGSYAGSADKQFGGSVAKHTYVDGFSDIDCLITMDAGDLEGDLPPSALKQIAAVAEKIAVEASVSTGRMAVTLAFADGMEIQLLPAVRAEDGRVHVPSSDGEGWSEIDPSTFREALTKRNAECGGKLVPTVKLAKAVLANLSEQLLSGYHVESLAIEAFRGYAGLKTTAAMLPSFFERARTLVLQPIRDSTGQSVHVDSYLGEADSHARQEISFTLGRIARQMRTASAADSLERWQDFFERTD